MRLTSDVVIGRPPAEVFEALLQAERVAGCVPGGRLTGTAGGAGSGRYTGEAAVNVGPLRTAYVGTVRYLEVDREARAVVVRTSGSERTGQGDADAHIVARVLPDGAGAAPPERSVLSVDVDLLVRGRVAQLGQGILGELGRRLVAEFAGNVERLLAEQAAAATGVPGSGAPPDERPPGAEPAPGRTGAAVSKPRRATRAAAAVAGGVAVVGVLLGWWFRRGHAADRRSRRC